MSRTKRKIKKSNYGQNYGDNGSVIIEGGDAWVRRNGKLSRRKMTPYTKKGLDDVKIKADSYTGMAPTPQDKLVVKNANRAKKKAFRQKLKLELKDEIQSISGRYKVSL